MSEELRERYALAAAEWALMYPISSWALRAGEAAEKLAKVWGEQIARYLTEYVRDEELERLRAERDALNAAVERVRALHSPRDRGAGPECMGCRTTATFTPYEVCRTLAALDGRS